MKLRGNFQFIFITVATLFLFGACSDKEENGLNHLPVAHFSVEPARGIVTTHFGFDANGVSDIEDPVSSLEVRWDWNDDGIYDTEFSTTKDTSHRYASPGLYFPLMQVRDTKGMMDSTRQMINVVNDIGNLPPGMPIYLTPPDYQIWMERDVIFKWTCTDPENDDLTFDLWIGKSIATIQAVKTGISDFNMVDGVMVYETTLTVSEFEREYHWQIFARDGAGNYTPGHVWRFKTRPE